MLTAIVRGISPGIAAGARLHKAAASMDVAVATVQHRRFVQELAAAGARVVALPAVKELPDSAFVEDVAVVLDEVAVLGRMGAAGREPEVALMAEVLAKHRPLRRIEPPGTLEGGDVLRIERRLLVGLSSRTNASGAGQLAAIARPLGYTVETIPVRGCLHLKTACTHVGGAAGHDVLLVNPEWVDVTALRGFELLHVAPQEPWGANSLRVNDKLFVPASAPRTAERMAAHGLAPIAINISEIEKAEAGLTCLALLL